MMAEGTMSGRAEAYRLPLTISRGASWPAVWVAHTSPDCAAFVPSGGTLNPPSLDGLVAEEFPFGRLDLGATVDAALRTARLPTDAGNPSVIGVKGAGPDPRGLRPPGHAPVPSPPAA